MDLRICVYQNQACKRDDVRIFERLVKVPVGVSPSYDSLIENMKFLFGVQCIVTFEVV